MANSKLSGAKKVMRMWEEARMRQEEAEPGCAAGFRPYLKALKKK